jgi:hypothetical protein
VGMVTIAMNQDPGVQADYYCGSLLNLLTLPILEPTNSEPKA